MLSRFADLHRRQKSVQFINIFADIPSKCVKIEEIFFPSHWMLPSLKNCMNTVVDKDELTSTFTNLILFDVWTKIRRHGWLARPRQTPPAPSLPQASDTSNDRARIFGPEYIN